MPTIPSTSATGNTARRAPASSSGRGGGGIQTKARPRDNGTVNVPRVRGSPEAVDAVTPEQAQAIAQKYIHPEKIVVVAVGDKTKIEDEMKKLNLGKMEIRDAQGRIAQ